MPNDAPPPPQKQLEPTTIEKEPLPTPAVESSVAALDETENVGTDEPPQTDTVAEQMTKYFYLKFSLVAKPFALPSYSEIALAGLTYFQQEGIKCIPIRTHNETCYKFELREEVQCEGHSLTFAAFEAPLTPWVKRQKQPRKEGTLLTFRNAGTGALELIPSDAFDQSIKRLNLVPIVPTRMQRIKDTRVLNGNRFCVVETPDNMKAIPESMPVVDPNSNEKFQVNVSFKGQERYCSTCNEMHVGMCPKIAERRRKQSQREAMQKDFVSKIYSDSTLRCADALGLKSEVLCMSGGGLGQIIQAVIDDPDENEKIVILGGTNDAKVENFVFTHDYCDNIDLSIAKLANHAKENQNKTFLLVHQEPTRADEVTKGMEATVRDVYLATRMKQIADSVHNIEAVEIKYEADHTGHPTIEGTKEILSALNTLEFCGESLIWDDSTITTEKPYSKVQSIYRYGCNGCNRYGTELKKDSHTNQLLCDDCHELFTQEENELLYDIATRAKIWEENARATDFPEAKRAKGERDQMQF